MNEVVNELKKQLKQGLPVIEIEADFRAVQSSADGLDYLTYEAEVWSIYIGDDDDDASKRGIVYWNHNASVAFYTDTASDGLLHASVLRGLANFMDALREAAKQ
jgi:hypothetical protein